MKLESRKHSPLTKGIRLMKLLFLLILAGMTALSPAISHALCPRCSEIQQKEQEIQNQEALRGLAEGAQAGTSEGSDEWNDWQRRIDDCNNTIENLQCEIETLKTMACTCNNEPPPPEEPTQPEPTQPEPTQPEPTQPEPTQPEPVQ